LFLYQIKEIQLPYFCFGIKFLKCIKFIFESSFNNKIGRNSRSLFDYSNFIVETSFEDHILPLKNEDTCTSINPALHPYIKKKSFLLKTFKN